MRNLIISTLAVGGLMSTHSAVQMDVPHIDLIMQSTRTAEWIATPRATIGQSSTRRVRLRGPWMDYVTSATSSNGVSARNIEHEDHQVTMILDASASAARGDMNLRLNITCPPGGNLLQCGSSVQLPIKIFETGPINTIQPSGIVPPNSVITFDLTGEAMGVAKLNARLLSLSGASVLSRTSTSIKVKGKTPSCGYVDVALTDEAGDGEFVYRKSGSLQQVLAGTICGSSLAPPLLGQSHCIAPKIWDPVALICKDP